MENLKKQQKKILKKIYNCEFLSSDNPESILSIIKNHSKEDAVYAMGDFGKRLLNFANDIDLSHPDIKNIFNGELTEEGCFSRDASDLIKLATYGKTWGLTSNVRSSLLRNVSSKLIYKSLDQSLDSPKKNLLHIRLLEDKSDRDACRSVKQAQTISLGYLYKQNTWEKYPSDFNDSWHGVLQYEKDIKEAKKKVQKFLDNGLVSMAKEIESCVCKMERDSKINHYMGFNKISLSSASVILSKMMGYVYESLERGRGDFLSEIKNLCYIPEGVFEEKYMPSSKCAYTPRAYTFCEFSHIASNEMKELVGFLEEYPPLGNRPLFDHYRILVPGGLWKSSYQKGSYSGDSDGTGRFYFPDVSNMQKELDETLIKEGKIITLLLGERDGEHYLISYWM